MTDSDLTLKVLVEMRDELRTIRNEATNVNRHLGELREGQHRLEQHAARTNQRLEIIEHTMVDFGTQVVLLGRYTKNSVTRHDSDAERHDEEIADLRTRVEKLEAKD
jgi:predicted  nucleic acid-binding Zn-ribbon protein